MYHDVARWTMVPPKGARGEASLAASFYARRDWSEQEHHQENASATNFTQPTKARTPENTRLVRRYSNRSDAHADFERIYV